MYGGLGIHGDDPQSLLYLHHQERLQTPSEVFDKIVTDDRILERAASVTQGYDDFIQNAHQYDGSTMWELASEGHVAGQYDRREELKRKLYRAVANVNILEGIRFYVSFACSFAFGELKLMEGSAKIISLIARDENQHLAITQNILNKWRSGDDPEMKQIMKGRRGVDSQGI